MGMNAHNSSIIRKGRLSLKIYLSFWHTENSKIKEFSVKWQKQNIRDIYYHKKIHTFWDTCPTVDSSGHIPLYLKDPWKKDNKKIINFCRFSLMFLFFSVISFNSDSFSIVMNMLVSSGIWQILHSLFTLHQLLWEDLIILSWLQNWHVIYSLLLPG